MADDKKKPKKKVVKNVAGTAIEEAFKKGRRSGMASANAKKPKRKKGPKQYRMKKIIPHMKSSYGKMQTKHPVITGIIEAGTVGAVVVGAATGTVRALGVPTHQLSSKVDRIPIVRGFYRGGQKAVHTIIGWFR